MNLHMSSVLFGILPSRFHVHKLYNISVHILDLDADLMRGDEYKIIIDIDTSCKGGALFHLST